MSTRKTYYTLLPVPAFYGPVTIINPPEDKIEKKKKLVPL